MAGELARRARAVGRIAASQLAEQRLQPVAREPAGAQQAGVLGVAQVDDGALQADRAGAAVEDEVDGFAQLGGDVLGGGRADPARRVGARGDDRQPDLAQEGAGPRGCDGTRTATVDRPAVAAGRSAARAASGRTSVSGPGQNASASRSARASKAAMRRAPAASATCAISGLCAGRPFAR